MSASDSLFFICKIKEPLCLSIILNTKRVSCDLVETKERFDEFNACAGESVSLIFNIFGATSNYWSSPIEHSTHNRDILKMKACLFALCTSLAVNAHYQGQELALHPAMVKIRKLLEKVLLWPSLDVDEVSKAQHGCIDCLALMICAELQAPESSQDFV